MGAYRLSTSVKLTLGFWKCTSMHFPSLIGTFGTLKVIEVLPDVPPRVLCIGAHHDYFFHEWGPCLYIHFY